MASAWLAQHGPVALRAEDYRRPARRPPDGFPRQAISLGLRQRLSALSVSQLSLKLAISKVFLQFWSVMELVAPLGRLLNW